MNALKGPCHTCGVMFHTAGTKPRQFCSMKCYCISPQFKSMVKKNAILGAVRSNELKYRTWKPTVIACLQCGKDVRTKPGEARKRKYCSRICYRLYMAERFDRWIANPKTIALPQAFDEFLTSEILGCLVEGCDWSGDHLSLHMNQAHGVTAEQFKKLAGFNLTSGIISLPLHKLMCERPHTGVAFKDNLLRKPEHSRGYRVNYQSLEGREHRAKAQSLIVGPGPQRICLGCGGYFIQSHAMGRQLFHDIDCRVDYYARKAKERVAELSCVVCGTGFSASRDQKRRAMHGSPVVCSLRCKGVLNGSKPKPRRPGLDAIGGQIAEELKP